MKGYKHATAEQRQKILELYHQIKSTREIASEVGVTAEIVRLTIKRNGLPLRCIRDVGACYQNIHLLREMAAAGLSLRQMQIRLGLGKSHGIRDFLIKHNIEFVHHGQSSPGSKNPAWKGGRMIEKKRKKGKKQYVLIHMPSHPFANRHGYVREHRIVMEAQIGRYLDPKEVVHHKNGKTLDNRPENLELFSSNGEHLAHELTGKVPKWTEEGKRRILESIRRPRAKKRKPSHAETAADDRP